MVYISNPSYRGRIRKIYFKFSSKNVCVNTNCIISLLELIVSYKINKQNTKIEISKIADIRRRNHNRLCSFAKLNAKKPSVEK